MPKKNKSRVKTGGNTARRAAARCSVLDGKDWHRLSARRGFLIDRLEKHVLKKWQFEELKGLHMLADARCEKHKAPND